jgi:hypothetical protein
LFLNLRTKKNNRILEHASLWITFEGPALRAIRSTTCKHKTITDELSGQRSKKGKVADKGCWVMGRCITINGPSQLKASGLSSRIESAGEFGGIVVLKKRLNRMGAGATTERLGKIRRWRRG